MTTIATDGKTVAADTLMTSNIRDCFDFIKVRKIGKDIVACSGGADEIVAYFNWISGKSTVKPIIEESNKFHALHVNKDGVFYTCAPNWSKFNVDVPYALGSGGSIALGAMLAGASPAEAIRIAMKKDLYTGGTVTELHVKA
jgi:ATP-dependent protease HslVU (ClpYQ) peptidase subunit